MPRRNAEQRADRLSVPEQLAEIRTDVTWLKRGIGGLYVIFGGLAAASVWALAQGAGRGAETALRAVLPLV